MDLDTNQGEIRYLTPLDINTNSKRKYCRFKRLGIKYIDYKDPDYLLKFVNEQGKILPRRLTGTSLIYQRREQDTLHYFLIKLTYLNKTNGTYIKRRCRKLRIQR